MNALRRRARAAYAGIAAISAYAGACGVAFIREFSWLQVVYLGVRSEGSATTTTSRRHTMHAHIGDEIIVDGPHQGDLPTKGEVLEVRELGGVEHYRVRWDDGHEGLFYPGADAHSIHPGGPR